MKPLEILKDVLYTARVYLRITCVIWTCACALYYAYYCVTGNALRLTVPVTLVVQHLDGIDISTSSLGVSISGEGEAKRAAKALGVK